MSGPPPPPGAKPPAPQALVLPKPAAVAQGPLRPYAFSFTDEDVRAAVDDLLADLGAPTPIESSGPITTILIVGDKDAKTINALAVKTPNCAGLPRPAGSRVVCLAFDNQSELSFRHFLREKKWTLDAGEMPVFVQFYEPKGRHRGLLNSEDPANGAYVVAVFEETLRRIQERRDVGLLVVDHYGAFIEDRYTDFALYTANKKRFTELDPGDWIPRNKKRESVDRRLRSAVVPGGYVAATGYRNKGDGEDFTLIRPDGKRVQGKKAEKWRRTIFKDWNVMAQSYSEENDAGETQYWVELESGRHEFLSKGKKVYVTDKNLGSFFETDPFQAGP